ncbi:MAG: NUDIX domain-containing protein [Candidatus Pacearchaeota archaeon]|nr:MAG: NUDIX domain-containing protein [Candidatus Pacearchaeota archaeon]
MPEQKKRKMKKQKVKYELSCGAIIFHISKDQPNYLLVKYPTYWGFVKGLVEPGETEEQTAFRETLEEVGITDLVFIPHFRETQQWFYRLKGQLRRKEAVFLLAKTKTWNVKISHEHENFKWCTYDEALKLIRVKGVRQLLTRAHNFLQKILRQKNLKDFF